MDMSISLSLIATTVTIISFVYGFLRNFKNYINSHIDRLEKRMDKLDERMDKLDERMFFILTGRNLEDAILEERSKRSKLDK